MKRKTITSIVLQSLVVILCAFWLLPLYWLVRSSLMDMTQIFVFPPVLIPKPIQFVNFYEALTVLPFLRYFTNTVTIVIFSVSGMLVSSTISAYGLTRVDWKYRNLVFTILMSTMLLPYFTVLIPNFIMWRTIGLTDTYMPMIIPSWFSMGTSSIYGGGMFNIFLLRQFYKTIPKELDEAAVVDGAGHFTIFTKIILPLSKPAITSVGLFTFLNSWNDFINPLIYLSDDRKYTIQLGLRTFIGLFNAQWHLMMAAAVVAIVPVIIVFLFGQKYFVKGIATTGLKG